MAGTRKRRPDLLSMHFFKVVLSSALRTKTLTFPPKFARKYMSELSNSVTISIPNGRKWRVGLQTDENDVWLQENWHEFVKHHSITEGYFLVFRYEGNSSFHVLIFDQTACEIEYPESAMEMGDDEVEYIGDIATKSIWPNLSSRKFYRRCKRKKIFDSDPRPRFNDDDLTQSSNSDCAGATFRLKKKMAATHEFVRGRKTVQKRSDLGKFRNEYEYPKITGKPINEPDQRSVSSNGVSVNRKRIEMDLKIDIDSSETNRFKMNSKTVNDSTEKPSAKCKKKRFETKSRTENDSDEEPGMKRKRKRFETDSKTSNDKEIIISKRFGFQCSSSYEAIRKAGMLKLKNVSFMVVLKQNNIRNSFVYVPKEFARKVLTGDFETVKILDRRGREWCVKVKRERIRHAFLRGCCFFMRANDLKAGDICVFELIKTRGEVGLNLWVID